MAPPRPTRENPPMTESAVSLPPAGWYPDPEGAQPRWWDGTRWYPSQPVLPPRPAPRVGAGVRTLGAWVRGLIWCQVALLAIALPIWLWGILMSLTGERTQGVYGGTLYDGVDMVTALLGATLWLATAVVWMVWQYRLARMTPRDALRRAPAWHVGSWLVPVANLWRPAQDVRDLAQHHTGRTLPLDAWWTLWVIGVVTNRALFVIVMTWTDTFSFQLYNLLSLVDGILWISCGILAVGIVRRLTEAALDRVPDGS